VLGCYTLALQYCLLGSPNYFCDTNDKTRAVTMMDGSWRVKPHALVVRQNNI
jgi:hypothetical protein